MTSERVRDMPASGALTGPEKFYADNGALDVYVTANQIKTFASVPASSGTVTVSDTTPSSPAVNALWIEPDTGRVRQALTTPAWDPYKALTRQGLFNRTPVITFSDDNRTVTGHTEPANAIATTAITGKKVFSVTLSRTNTAAGVSNVLQDVSGEGYLGENANGAGYFADTTGGGWFFNNSSGGIPAEVFSGSFPRTVYLAIDVTAKKLWARLDSDTIWNGSAGADPVTGTGALDISLMTGSIYPACGLTTTLSTGILDPAATGLSPPSGFTALSESVTYKELGYLKSNIANGNQDYINAADAPWNATGNGSTDDTAAIQGALDYAMINGITTVFLPDGNYKTTDTLHVGWGYTYLGVNFFTIRLVGLVPRPGASDVSHGPTISPTFKDRPVINIAGGRFSGVENLSISGPTAFTTPANPLLRANSANFIPAGAVDNSNAPYCAVAVDGWAGGSPAVPYPTTSVLPSWLGGGTLSYGRNICSGITVRNCRFSNTVIGLAVGTNQGANNDFLDAEGNAYSNLKWGIVIGPVNSRSNNFSNSNFATCWGCIDGANYNSGGNNGNVAGTWDNIHIQGCYKFTEYDASNSRRVVVTNSYAEDLVILGQWYSGVGQANPTFISCNFQFFPMSWSGSAFNNAFVESYVGDHANFIGCQFRGNFSNWAFLNCTFSDCQFTLGGNGSPALSGTESIATNAFNRVLLQTGTMSGSLTWNENFGSGDGESRFTKNCAFGNVYYSGYDDTNFSSWWSIGCCTDVAPATGGRTTIPYVVPTIQRFKFLGAALTNRVMIGGGFTTDQVDGMFSLGDMIVVGVANNWLYCSNIVSIGGGNSTYTFTLLTNFAVTAGVVTSNSDLSNVALKIYYWPVNVVKFGFDRTRFWVTTSGSNVMQSVTSTGASATIPGAITTASLPFWFGSGSIPGVARFMPFPAETTISSVAANSVTMSANAQVSGVYAAAPGISRRLDNP
jgi:hypothetical protein